MVDEAQDVRQLYVRLLRALGLVDNEMSILVVGDRNQLVYDFDEDFPASLDTLLHPERLLGGGTWTRTQLLSSHRLTGPMAAFANAIFGTSICGVRDGPPVEVRVPKSAFDLHAALADLFEEEDDVLLLVDRKRNNRPLRALLNTVSRAGTHRVRVHGTDAETRADGRRETRREIRCGTYWSAKGLECEVAVVLLPAASARNPAYVALTRARQRLVVVIDPREPHAAACHAARACAAEGSVRLHDSRATATVEAGLRLSPHESFECRVYGASSNVNRLVPRRHLFDREVRRVVVPSHVAEDVQEPVWCEVNAEMRDLSSVLVIMALVAAEARACHGRVRAMEDILHPTRMEAGQVFAAIGAGFVGRHVPKNVPDDALLAADLRRVAARAYERLRASNASDLEALAEVALAVQAWNDFDHTMRSFLPVSGWARSFKVQYVLDRTSALLPVAPGTRYDHILLQDERHCRVHASTPEECVHVVWNASSDDFGQASVRAAMHVSGVCMLVEMGTGKAYRLSAPSNLLRWMRTE